MEQAKKEAKLGTQGLTHPEKVRAGKPPVNKAAKPSRNEDAPPPDAKSPPPRRRKEPQPEVAAAEPAGKPFLQRLKTAPPWLVSMSMHVVLVLLLLIWTFNLEDENKVAFINSVTADTEEFEELEAVELEVFEPQEVNDVSLEVAEMDIGAVDFGDFSVNAEVTVSQADVSVNSLMDDVGALFGSEGIGMTSIGEGIGGIGKAEFFGTKTSGQRFVFVVDNSNSMQKGRFVTACTELMKSVGGMSEQQEFYVIFYSDQAYRLFHPQPAPGFVRATEENKQRLQYWLQTVQMCLRTNGVEAMKMAISLRPDVIYILGDGAYGDDVDSVLVAPHAWKIPIHTLGMEVNERGEKQLKAIAAANQGTYRAVAATPAAEKAQEKLNIPRNNKRGPVWGLQLPAK